MKKRIFWKFFAGCFLLSVLLSLAFYILTVGQVRSFYLRTQEESLAQLGLLVHAELAKSWPFADEQALDAFVKEKGRQTRVRFTVVDRRGRVLADSQKDPAAMQNHADRPEVAAALSGQSSTQIHFSFTLRERMLYYARPLKVGKTTVAALRLSQFVREIDQMFAFWRQRLTLLLLVLLAISLLISLFLSRNLTRPIHSLAKAARSLGEGSWLGHVPERRQDELGQLAIEFNAMADRQRATLEKLELSQHELEAILGSVSDGLLVIDARERIIRAGPRFCLLINDPDPVGKPYWEVLRLSAIDEMLQKANAGQTVHAEIEIQQKLFLASLSPLPANSGTVITFHDLSATRQLEKQKKDFVANVSHELRTPLTAIKGYAETLREEATGDAARYLEVILRHTDRLIGLTTDLLTLSALEQKGVPAQMEAVDWPDMMSRLRGLFEKRIREKKLSLEISLPERPLAVPFRGDAFRLEQMMVNLLDNAVKYTEQGGIAVRFSPAPARLHIEVEDSGVGIAAEHLPRLFERFYVADKARSRQTGGTGLGLAIAKHIVELHSGRISVHSTPGTGTLITIDFPLTPG